MKEITPEVEYRRRLRIVARIMDYSAELKKMGYEEELLYVLKQDAQKGMQYNKKIMQIFNSFTQKQLGYEEELLQLFVKYDNLLKNCKDDKEKKALGTLGVLEINKLLDNGEVGVNGNLIIDNQVVISDKSSIIEDKKIGK